VSSLRELALPRISAYHDTLVRPALAALKAASIAGGVGLLVHSGEGPGPGGRPALAPPDAAGRVRSCGTPRRRGWHLRALLQDLSLEREVRSASEVHLRDRGVPGAPGAGGAGGARSRLRRTEARGRTRVSPSDWWPLFSEVSAFLQATGSLQRALALVAEAEAALNRRAGWRYTLRGGAYPQWGPRGCLRSPGKLAAASF